MTATLRSDAVPAASPTGFATLRALGALTAIVLAAAAQWLLERARLQGVSPPDAAAVLFLIATVLAVVATWGRNELTAGACAFSIVVPTWPWWLACSPGALALVLATVFQGQASTRTVFWLWAGGIGLLFSAGAAQLISTRSSQRDQGGSDWTAGQIAVCCAVLIVVAVAMRTVFGLQYLPAFVESDEAWGPMSATALRDDPYAWFGLWDAGCNRMALVFHRVPSLLFGYSLWGARMGGVVLGTICTVCTFAFARRLVGNFPAFAAALLVAVTHTLVHWSRNGHGYIWVPTGAAVILWLFIRVWNGGSLLSWVATAVVMGITTQVYYAAYPFPVMLALTAFGWAVVSSVNWKAVVLSTLAIEMMTLLILAPQIRVILSNPELANVRGRSLFILSPENWEKMGPHPGQVLLEHAKATVMIFNSSSDFFSNYGARRSVVDAVTAAMIPLAAAMVVARIFSPVGWLCTTWWGAYLVIGVFLEGHPPAYHRIPTALLFSSLAVIWSLVQLSAAMRDGFRLPRSSVVAVCLVFALAAGVANAHYYFYEFRLARPMQHTAGVTWLMCRYAKTHTIIDATAVDGGEYIPIHNLFPQLECPDAKRIRSWHAADLWKISLLTQDDNVVLIVDPSVVVSHPAEPEGYRITRQYVDESIKYPGLTPLAVFELERVKP